MRPIAKFTSPRLSDTTFFAHCSLLGMFCFLCFTSAVGNELHYTGEEPKKHHYSSIDPSLESAEVLSEHTTKSCSATLNTYLT